MSGLLLHELKQTKPFASQELEAFLNLVRSADLINREVQAILKAFGLSQAQYNVLRILRGAGPDGLSCSELGTRLVSFDPDVTRLLDKLEIRGLVVRSRDSNDRRVVTVRATVPGMTLAADAMLDQQLLACHRKQFAPLSPEQRSHLIDMLECLRQPSLVTTSPS